MTRHAMLLSALLVLGAFALRAEGQHTTHNELSIVPAPGRVTVDGDLTDWDASGAIYVCGNVQAGWFRQAAWVQAMHDADNLYLAFRVFDPTPLNSTIDPQVSTHGWEGDCVQIRLRTDRACHLTSWRHAQSRRPALHVATGARAHADPSGVLKHLGGADLERGVQMAFATFQKPAVGYVQEMKVPWSVITTEWVTQSIKPL